MIATEFLQGLITNNMDLVTHDCTIYAALLTPQGKYNHDFFVMGVNAVFISIVKFNDARI